ncbi:DegT/DnrJ/EryC1/StrS family aminotransferase [Marinicrinis sediminis]|uniref:DegT/DnrJ/EryC1/StrS family aminotransferase n=1 Tax=Marinicrinis sediminis TaxID=1652465 RepID=A0ABW5R6V6_9BACL
MKNSMREDRFSMIVPLAKPDITSLEEKYVLEALRSGQLSFGDKLRGFEDSFRKLLKVPYALAMNSGTSALHVAVKALGLRPGDEVITTPYSFIASSNCLIYEGVKPIFIDIEPGTMNMDVSLLEAAVTSRTKAILAVHVFGQPCQMDEVQRVADLHHLKIIEDACEAIGAQWQGQPAGTLGDMSVFAFYPNKQITTGEGGMLITREQQGYEAASSYRNQGRNVNSEWLTHDRVGYNYRMSDLQAAVGLAQMERLDEILAKREAAALRYIQLIQAKQVPVQLIRVLPSCKMSWFVFVVVLPPSINRSRVIRQLQDNGIQSKPYFPSIHLQPAYQKRFGYQPDDFPVCEQMSEQTLAIPFYSLITSEEQEYVVEQLDTAVRREMP